MAPISFPRLSDRGVAHAIREFVERHYPSGDVPEGFAQSARVIYDDDVETGISRFRVVDHTGAGHAEIDWRPVEPEPPEDG